MQTKHGKLACAQGLGLDRESDLDAVLCFILLKDGHHDLGSVIDGQNNVSNASLEWTDEEAQRH